MAPRGNEARPWRIRWYYLRMQQAMFAVLIFCLTSLSAAGFQRNAESLSLSGCDTLDKVLHNPDEYVGKEFTVRAVYVHYVEGSWILPYPSCERSSPDEIVAIRVGNLSTSASDTLREFYQG